MSSSQATNPGDVLRLTSADLVNLLGAGTTNLEGLDLLQFDPAVAQQILQIKQSQTVASDPNLNTATVTARQPKPKPSHMGRQPRPQHVSGPYVEIAEQPKARGLRFRYECEGRSAGSIPGETSTPERKTFPTIKIHNYSGPAVIVVSCVTKDEPYRPHPHNLVGKDCKKGVCTLRIRDTNTVSFPHLGIQCAKKKDVDNNLKTRQDINVDPFQTGFKHKGQNIDLNVVRLCFQVFLPDETGKITRIVTPVVSQSIHDKKALNDLVICRVDRTSGKPKGGDEMFLLCEKINRDDVRVRFYEERDGHLLWEGFGDFGQNDVHRQYAIVFKTPPYKELYLTQPVEVYMQLQRTSDLEGSDPISFTYQPEDQDPDRILEKRKRKAASLSFLQDNAGSSNITPEALKQRLKLKATRTNSARVKHEPIIKEEALTPSPQYSINNTGSQNVVADLPDNMVTMSPMPVQYSEHQMDITSTTISSQASMSGGKMQYTPVSSQQTASQIPSVTLNQQLLQLLAQAGLVTTQHPNQPEQSLQQPVQQAPQPIQSNQQIQPIQQTQPQEQTVNPQVELLKQLFTSLAQAQNQPQNQNQLANNQQSVLTNNDPNMQQNLEMTSLGSLDPALLQTIMNSDSPMISFESFEGLTGSLSNIDYDPNVAQFETVGEDMNKQQQYDETSAAVQNLN